MAPVLLLIFFSIHRTVGLLFWAAVASAQAVIKMFSQRLFCSRFHHSVEPKSEKLVKNTGHSWVDRTAMITAPQNSIKSTKRRENVQSETLGGSDADTLMWIHSKHGYLQAILSDWRHAGIFSLEKKCTNWPKTCNGHRKKGKTEKRNEAFVWKKQTKERPGEKIDSAFTWRRCFLLHADEIVLRCLSVGLLLVISRKAEFLLS